MGDITVKGANKIFGQCGFTIAKNDLGYYEATSKLVDPLQAKTLVELCQKILAIVASNTCFEGQNA